MEKDSLPSSPDMVNHVEDDDMVYIGDVEEVIDNFDGEEIKEENVMELDTPELGDSEFVFNGHKSGSVFCGSLSKSGKLGTTGGEDDKAYVWDTSTGEIVLDCIDHKDSIIYSAFNHDESLLATGDMSGVIQVWRLSDKSKIWDYNMGDAIWMIWHPAANVLLAGSVNGAVYMWKIPDGDYKVLQGYGRRAETGTLFPDGKRIAVGYEDGVIKIHDLKTATVLSSIASPLSHSCTITTIDCHPDNNILISAALDGKTIISSSKTGKMISLLQNLSYKIYSTRSVEQKAMLRVQEEENNEGNNDSNWVETVAFCKDPAFQVAATGTVNGEIFIWDTARIILRQRIVHGRGISKLVWKGNTSILFSAGLDGILRCFDGRNGECLRSFTGHVADILDLSISENGEKALTTSDDSTARIFDISSIP